MKSRTSTLEDTKQTIMDTIQRVYGDASQSLLDRKAAVEIVKDFERLGWMDPFTLRAIVAAAGGKIVLESDQLMDPPEELLLYEQMDPPAHVLRTRRVVSLD